MNASRARRSLRTLATGALLAVVLQACATLGPDFETPTVTVRSVRALPSSGALPDFEIGLHVVNPNREPLALRGLAYSVRLDGHELIKGASNALPVIDGFGEGDITVTASPNLLAGIAFVSDLLGGSRSQVAYSLEAKLDVGWLRALRIRDEGEITLGASPRR